MLKSLLKFEFSFHSKQIGFWVVMTVMVLFGLGAALLPDLFGRGLGGARIKANGAQMIAAGLSAAYLPVIFFGGVFTVTGVLRDKTTNMLELVHSTPVTTRDMTLSRMIGIFTVVCLSLFVFLLAQFLGQFSPTVDKETLGPINPIYYLQPFIVLTVINALIVTAFFTLIAGLTQNRVAVLVSAIGLFFYSMMVGVLDVVDAPKWLQAVADPFASIAYALDTEFWNPLERNTQLLPLTGYVGLNRLIWTPVSMLILLFVFRKFKRGLFAGNTNLKQFRGFEPTGESYSGTLQKSGFVADFIGFWTRFKFEYLTMVKSIPFMILAGIAGALFVLLVSVTVFFAPQKLIPTSLFMSAIGFTSLFIPMIIIIAFFSAELVFRDKGAKFNELLDSTHISNWPLLASKWLALMAIVTTLCAMGMVISMTLQAVTDSPPIDFGLYFRYTFLNVLPNYLFICALAMIVQIFVPNRIIGMIAAASVIIAVMFGISRLPFYHPLMGFGGTSPGAVSEISPYGNWISFRWFNFYWGMFVLVFAVLGVWLWRRGLQVGFFTRFFNLKQGVMPISASVFVLALAGFIGSGVHIYKAYDKVNWRNQKTVEARQIEAETLFARERAMAVPHTREVEIEADVYPSRQEATVKGKMILENSSGEPITELYVRAPTGKKDMRLLTIRGASERIEGENIDGDRVEKLNDFGVRLFEFDPPLEVGQKTALEFEAFFHAPRLADASSVSKNGTFMNNYFGFAASPRIIPVFGPFDSRITNPKKRRKLGLPELPKQPTPVSEGMNLNMFGSFTGPADRIDFKGRVCTEAPQIPIAPGNLIHEEKEGDRLCRTYQTAQPINNFYSVLSGEYVVTEDSWTSPEGKVIPIKIYHAEKHDYSIETMIKATQFGLSHYTEHLAPYQYDYFRIMEVPFIGFAQAFAGTIPYSEQGFIMDSGDPDDIKTIDNAALTTLHELGHQWFGHQVTPGYSRGYNVISEGLTSYITTDAYEAMYGWDKARYALENFTLTNMQAMAFIDREKEVPLSKARNDKLHLVYFKADWVLWGLKHYIGPQEMRDAMKGFIEEWGPKGPPYPTTKTLTDLLRETAGPDYDQFITDQWDRIVLWEFEHDDEGPSLTENEDGSWRVSIPIKTDKIIRTEEMETALSFSEMEGESLNEPLEIGFYSDEPKSLWSAYDQLEHVWVTKAAQTFTFDVATKPTHIALDPRRLMLENYVDDNVNSVGESSAYQR